MEKLKKATEGAVKNQMNKFISDKMGAMMQGKGSESGKMFSSLFDKGKNTTSS